MESFDTAQNRPNQPRKLNNLPKPFLARFDTPTGNGILSSGLGNQRRLLRGKCCEKARSLSLPYIHLVKTNPRRFLDTDFFVSTNEVAFAERHPADFYIYHVYEWREGASARKGPFGKIIHTRPVPAPCKMLTSGGQGK